VKDLSALKPKFVEGAKRLHDIPEEKSGEIFDLLLKFAGYGFNKSHSVAYALVAYQTAYLKAHYPAEFFAALITSVISDPDKMSWYISICRDRKIPVLPPDVNHSLAGFSVEKGAIRFGLTGIKGVGEAVADEVVKARQKGGAFSSISDFTSRVNMKALSRRFLENLIWCGAMDSLGLKRSQLLAMYEQALDSGLQYQKDQASGQMGLFDDGEFSSVMQIKPPRLNEIAKRELLKKEKELLGFYASGHPLEGYEKAMARLTPLRDLTGENASSFDGRNIYAGGLITSLEHRLTKKAETMAILTLEDFTGRMQVLVFPQAYNRARGILAEDAVVEIFGRFSIDEREAKIIASEIGEIKEGGELPIAVRQSVRQMPERPSPGGGAARRSAAPGGKRYYGVTADDYSVLSDPYEMQQMPAPFHRALPEYGGAGENAPRQGRAPCGAPSQKGAAGQAVRYPAAGAKTLARQAPPAGQSPRAVRERTGSGAPSGAADVVLLKVPHDKRTDAAAKELGSILRRHRGYNMVILYLYGESGRCEEKVRVDPGLYVDASEEKLDVLKKDLEGFLGQGTFFLQKKDADR